MQVRALILCVLVIQATESLNFRQVFESVNKLVRRDRSGGYLVPETTHTPPDTEPEDANEEETIKNANQYDEQKKRQILVPETTIKTPETIPLDDNEEYVTSDGLTFTKVSSNPWNAFEKAMRSTSDHPDLREGDIYVPKQDRQATDGTGCAQRWPKTIKYAFHGSFDMANADEVRQSFSTWQDNTCLTFVDITSDAAAQSSANHIIIKSDEPGCWSMLGMTCSNNGQNLNLGQGCIAQSVIIHEIGHALGLNHEQCREDRDSYVRINLENVQAGKEGNFNKDLGTLTYDMYYDYDSVMHYGRTFFSTNSGSKTTIETIDPLQQFRIGTQNSLSFKDKAIMNLMYDCGNGCSGSCTNGGYFNKDCECKCPPNYSGSSCETESGDLYQPMYDSCGNQIVTTEATITSFNWPNAHPDDTKCMWHLKPPSGKKAKITFDTFDLYDSTAIDYVHVLLDNFNGEQKYTGSQLNGVSKTSVDDTGMVIMWRSGYLGASTGFSATVTFVDVGGPSPAPAPAPAPSPSPAPKPKKKKNNKKKKKGGKKAKKGKKSKKNKKGKKKGF